MILPSEFATLERVDEIMLRCSHLAGLDEQTSNEVAMAVIEAVTNAVIHGNRLDKDKQVKLSCRWGPGEITISVQDEGEGFDLSCAHDPTDAEHCMDCSGRGIFIMRATMDEVEFEMSRDKGTTVKMTKCHSGTPEGGDGGS